MKLAITGSSMTTSVGAGKDTCFEAFCAGRTGLKPLQAFPRERFNVGHAYEIADRPDGRDFILRASEMLAESISNAIYEAALPPDARCLIVIGTGLRELRSLELLWNDGAPLVLDQLHFERMLNERLGIAFPVITISNACAASNFALAVAEDFLRDEAFDHVIVGGCDTITESMFGLLDRVNPLHPDTVRPFDRDRKGVLMGDGAAALVVESPARAKERGATMLAVVRGVGTSCDASHETAPDTGGIVRAMENAWLRSDVTPSDIDVVMVHGTGTSLNDRTEALAMQQAMGVAVAHPRICGLKSMTGHTSGASGLIGIVTAIEVLDSGIVPPTIGLEHVMDEARSLNIVNEAAFINASIAQINAFGFGGVNAVAVVEATS